MNSLEREGCEHLLGTSNGVTMEDYFIAFNNQLCGGVCDIDELKSGVKAAYPDVTDWSF